MILQWIEFNLENFEVNCFGEQNFEINPISDDYLQSVSEEVLQGNFLCPESIVIYES